MLTVVARKKQVKGQNNLEQQVAELKEVFAVYDEDGTGQLKQAEFVQAIISAGWCVSICCLFHLLHSFLARRLTALCLEHDQVS